VVPLRSKPQQGLLSWTVGSADKPPQSRLPTATGLLIVQEIPIAARPTKAQTATRGRSATRNADSTTTPLQTAQRPKSVGWQDTPSKPRAATTSTITTTNAGTQPPDWQLAIKALTLRADAQDARVTAIHDKTNDMSHKLQQLQTTQSKGTSDVLDALTKLAAVVAGMKSRLDTEETEEAKLKRLRTTA